MIDDIMTYLQSLGLGTPGTNLFASFVPSSPDNLISVLDTGGPEPDKYSPTKEPTFQVFIRNTNYVDGKSKLDTIRNNLHQTKNTTRGNTFFYFILAISEGGHIGRNPETGLEEFSINFRCRTR